MARKKKKSGVAGIVIIMIAILALMGIIAYKTIDLKETLNIRQEQLDKLNSEIADAKEETQDIEAELKYRQTDDYIEDEARDLGLVYPDEIVIAPSEDEK